MDIKNIKKLTLNEFLEKKKEYFTTSGNENIVVKCFSVSGYQFWMKCKTLEDIARIYWKHEPLMKRYFNDENGVLEQLKKSMPNGISGCWVRWLPGNLANHDTVCLQPFCIPADNVIGYIDDMYETSLKDSFFGLLMDPYTYTQKLKENEDDEFDMHCPEFKDPANYCVFYTEMTVDEYNKQEQEYVDSIEYGNEFDDGLIHLSMGGRDKENSDIMKQLYSEHTQFNL